MGEDIDIQELERLGYDAAAIVRILNLLYPERFKVIKWLDADTIIDTAPSQTR